MNIHHLELFYYVARHGGITEAVRNIPYGIQQPAVSGQVAQLEEYLGVTLFQRRPFALTPAGEKLYQFVQPFFANLDLIASDLQGGKARQILLELPVVRPDGALTGMLALDNLLEALGEEIDGVVGVMRAQRTRELRLRS